jgi:hypothetical protein
VEPAQRIDLLLEDTRRIRVAVREPEIDSLMRESVAALRRDIVPAVRFAYLLMERCGHDDGLWLLEKTGDGIVRNRLVDHMQAAVLEVIGEADPALLIGPLLDSVTHLLNKIPQYASEGTVRFLEQLTQKVFERLTALGMDGREAVHRLLRMAESFIVRFEAAAPSRFWAPLESAILSWAAGPKPYLDPVGPGESDEIRRTLAAQIKYPGCLYLGRIWHRKERWQDQGSTGYRPQMQQPQRSLVLARCAALHWRALFEADRRALRLELTDVRFATTQQEAFAAVADAVRVGDGRVLADLGEDLIWAIFLLDLLDPTASRRGKQTSVARLPRMPRALRADVLTHSPKDASCFGYWLADLLVRNRWASGAAMLNFVRLTQNQAKARVRTMLLGRGSGKQSESAFDFEDDLVIAHRLDRTLFVLRLLAAAKAQWQTREPETDIRDFIRRSFKLPEAARPRIARFLDDPRHHPYRLAIADLQGSNYLGPLPGWHIYSPSSIRKAAPGPFDESEKEYP